LVERLLCKQDVSGSSPLTSISSIIRQNPDGERREQLTRIDPLTMELISAPTK
jgi:hypothetical protein